MAVYSQYPGYGSNAVPVANPAFGEVPTDYRLDPNLNLQSRPASSVPVQAGQALGAYQLGNSLWNAGTSTTTAPAAAGLGFGPIAVGAAGVAGTLAARDAANRQGGSTPAALSAIQALNPVHQAAEAFSGVKNLARGGRLTTSQQLATAVPTLGTSFAVNPVMNALGIGHDPDTLQRMGVKRSLDAAGLGPQLSWQTPAGQVLDMRNAQYNVDMKNPLAAQAIGYANPFAFAFTNQLQLGDKFRKAGTDLSGQIANTLMTGAKTADDVKNNILSFAQKMGVTPEQLRTSLKNMVEQKLISQQESDAFSAAISNLTTGTGAQNLSAATGPRTSLTPAAVAAALNKNKGKGGES